MSERNDQCVLTPTVTVCLSGSGGQGLLLAGRLLAEAAALYDGLDVVQTNSYGPEARGGASRSEVVIGRGEIDVLHAPAVDVLVCLNQASCDTYYHHLVPSGLLITDRDLVKVVPTTRALEVPVTALARQEVGNVVVANVVALAVVCAISKIVTREALVQAVTQRTPPAHRESNLKAVDIGFAAAEELLGSLTPKARAVLPDFSFVRQGFTPARKRNGAAAAAARTFARAEVLKASMREAVRSVG